ncbi:MAG: dephospho-CoA kinase [Cellvibrionaceae bacterium]|jgi:dephospho-CoA kinase
MFVLGVTGGIGSGKTAATDRFASHGIKIVDADSIARQVVGIGSPALEKISSHFGRSILQADGALDRKALREIIFSNIKEKEWLEGYLHPIIREKMLAVVQLSTSPYTILSAPLLLENNLEFLTTKVLVIDCSEAIQIDRACRRDNSSIASIQKIMQQQLSRRERLASADSVIVNDGSIEDLNKAVDQYHFPLVEELCNQDAVTGSEEGSEKRRAIRRTIV